MRRDKVSGPVCLIQGLTSAKGQTLNGSAATYDPTKEAPHDGRVAVTIDGVPEQLSIKAENLKVIHQPTEDLAIGVGRKNLRSPEAMATVVDQKRGERITAQMIEADTSSVALRSEGTLKAFQDYLSKKKLPRNTRSIVVIHVTDLNIARLLNAYSRKKSSISIEASQKALANFAKTHLLKHEGTIVFKYTPFRIQRGDHPSKDRHQAAISGRFHIYPCPLEDYLDALEVRFQNAEGSTHEFFLDFGKQETIQYIRNAHSMKELNRLSPKILADVDPQMFWSFVLHSKWVVKQLKNLEPSCPELMTEWSCILGSYLQSLEYFRDLCWKSSEAVRLLPDAHGQWNLINNQIHHNVATRNAKLAIVMMLEWTKEASKEHTLFAVELDNEEWLVRTITMGGVTS